jgi:sarcosine oxidase subunit beta
MERRATKHSQIAVIGAGVIGLSTAYHLASHGFSSITVYEREGIGSGASGIAPGGVRRQWATAVNCAMSGESLQFYRRIDEILEPDTQLVFRECGYLFLAHSEAALEHLRANVALQSEFRIPSRILAPHEIGKIVPALKTETVTGASYCPEDGYFDDPWGVIFAFARAAQRRGVRIENSIVLGLHHERNAWQLQLEDGTAAAEQVVIAAGGDSVQLLKPLGLELPIRAEPRYLFYSNVFSERICDPLVISNEREFAVKQMSNGQFLTSYLGAGRHGREQTPEAWKARISEVAEELIPALLDVSLTHMVKGYYDMTPDSQPIVGPIPDRNNLWVAAGLSGHGFMMAPAVGRAIADLIRGVDPAWYFRGLGLARFSGEAQSGRLTAERQVI